MQPTGNAFVSIGLLKIFLRALARVIAFAAAYNLAVFRGFQIDEILRTFETLWPYGLVYVLIGLFIDILTRVDRTSWRFVSVHEALVVLRNSTAAILIFLVATFVIDRAENLPRSTLILTWAIDIGLYLTALLLRRAIHERAFGPVLLPLFAGLVRQDERRPLLLIGGMDSADTFLKDIARNASSVFRAVGMIAVEPTETGRELRGVKVISSLASAGSTLERFAIENPNGAVVFLDAKCTAADIDAETLGSLRERGIQLLRKPILTEMGGVLPSSGLRELRIEELLSRPPVSLALDQINELVSGARVMITGAGGSIGSEICRQVAALGCAHITMIDHSEFALFKIGQEIETRYATLSLVSGICDIRNADRFSRWVEREKPDIIFHAAALKHVPLMETHPCECVETNVVGTWNVAEAARKHAVTHMVFISTDKAVDPSNVMGATKRLAESIVRFHHAAGSETRFSVVRFGNVLGSAGSVVPTFLDQIASGGPITVTHPDVQRYFMTIPEAVQLVLHATATSAAKTDPLSSLFVLDMGQPVKIVELAKRLIELSEKPVGREISIQFTGLRPGEKLTEHLVDSNEQISSVETGVFEVRDQVRGDALDSAAIANFARVAAIGDPVEMRRLIFEKLALVRRSN